MFPVLLPTVFFHAGWGGSLPDTGGVNYNLYLNSLDSGVIVLPPTKEWSWARSKYLSGYKVKGIRIWFSAGCKNLVQIRLHYNHSPWLPDLPSYSDYYIGDDKLIWIPTNRIIDNNDQVDIYFQNFDIECHKVDIKFDTIGEKEWESQTPQDRLAKKGKGNVINW